MNRIPHTPEQIQYAWNRMTGPERAEVRRLLKVKPIPELLDGSFDLQREFIEDDCKLKALFCTRRSAKSYTAGLYLIDTALKNPGTSSVYLGLTRDQSKRIIWQDILKAIIKKYDVPVKFNETELTVTFENGSIIYVLGVNDSQAEADKLLGKKFALCVIDEAASYTIDLTSLVFKVLKPACSDLAGTIVMCGTPDNRQNGIFYELTKNVQVSPPNKTYKDGWSVHAWTAHDNPHMAKQWAETIADLRKTHEFLDELPWFSQHYLGKWTTETDALIYKFDMTRNTYLELPSTSAPFDYVLGIDLGWNDASALALLAYNRYDKNTYIMKSGKWRGLTLTDLGDKIRSYMAEYPISRMIVDGAAKQAVQEMIQHQQLPLEPAQKQDKNNYIRIMNDAFIGGRIKLHEPMNREYIKELQTCIWDADAILKGVLKPDSSVHGDITDAALYAFRFTYSYTAEKDPLAHLSDYEKEKRMMDQEFERLKQEREYGMSGDEYLYD